MLVPFPSSKAKHKTYLVLPVINGLLTLQDDLTFHFDSNRSWIPQQVVIKVSAAFSKFRLNENFGKGDQYFYQFY